MRKGREGKKQEGNALEELIAEILLPMSDVVVMKDRAGRISIFKEGIKFGMIQDEAFHLFDKGGEYQKVKKRINLRCGQTLARSYKIILVCLWKDGFFKA